MYWQTNRRRNVGRPTLTTTEWIKRANQFHKDIYEYTKATYVGYGKPITGPCREHGDFIQKENNHRNGAGCPKCGAVSRQNKRSHSYESFVEAANKAHNSAYTYPKQEVYNSRTKIKIECAEHGEFIQLAYTHLAGSGCPKCGYARSGKKSRLSISEFMRRAAEVHGNTYEYVSGLSGMHRNMTINCKLHGVFRQTPANHLHGAGCPKCVGKISRGEAEIFEFITSLGVAAHGNDRTVIGPKELDIYIPESKVAIEYNGLWFHREELIGNKTREKWEACTKQGVKLIQIFEDEWASSRKAVEDRLRAILGKTPTVHARKTTVVRPTPTQTKAFLQSKHTQGAGGVLSRAYGLELNGELVAVATFGKGRFKNAGWELLRYASEGRVVGGISKLVAAFRKDHPAGQIISYADLRWGDGEAYRAAGFSLVCITEPDYWWADIGQNVRHPRYSLQRHKTGQTEKEYAKQRGWVKVLGVGHKKWVFN
jgi:Zn finger protein HypA/HybF involved in hydrogenase expression